MSGTSFHGQIDDSNIFTGNNFSGGTVNIHIQPKQHEACENRPTKPSHLRKDCSQSLAFPEMQYRLLEIDKATEDTCSWITCHEIFKSWKDDKRSPLWIRGKPGSGKSTLLKYMIQKIETEFSSNDVVLISFFFNGQGVKLQKTLLGFYRSILYQLLKDPLNEMDDLLSSFEEKSNNIGIANKEWSWHERELQGIFLSSLLKVLQKRPVWLFVDALDECDEGAAVSLINNFRRWVKNIPPLALAFRICLSGRHYPILDLGGGFEICVEHENTEDIATFVQTELSVLQAESLLDLKKKITDRADGVFMWANLVVQRVLALVRRGEGLEKIRAEIERIPPDLDSLYTELVEKMKTVENSLILIQWVSFSSGPLTVEELRWAMAVSADDAHPSLQQCRQSPDFVSDNATMERKIKTLGCGLVEIVGFGTETFVQFIHQSAKDFFVEKGLSALMFTSNASSTPTSSKPVAEIAHYSLSTACMRYLDMHEIHLFLKAPCVHESATKPHWDQTIQELCVFWQNMMEKFPFLEYSIEKWKFHMRESRPRSECGNRLEEHLEWSLSQVLDLWFIGCSKLDRHLDIDYLMQNAILLDRILPSFLPLAFGFQETVSSRFWLSYYIPKITPETRSRLLSLRITKQKQYQLGPGASFLWMELGLDDGFKTVLRSGIPDFGWRNEEGMSLLSIAAKHGHGRIVKSLIRTGRANIDSRDNYGRTALLLAAKRGHKDVVRDLLHAGQADANLGDIDGYTPMLVAKAGGFNDIVQLLLGAGQANVDFETCHNSKPSSASEAVWEWLWARLTLLNEQIEE